MAKTSKNSDEMALEVRTEQKTANRLMKKMFTPKNVIILILLLTTVISVSIASAQADRASDLQEHIDSMFVQTYNELIIDSRNRNLVYDVDFFTPYDIQNATRTRFVLSIFEATSYRDNNSLGELLNILNDYIGENRMYPEKPYDELSDSLYDDLFQLSRDFSNKKKAKAVLVMLKTVIGAK